jgi:hypothetical protein
MEKLILSISEKDSYWLASLKDYTKRYGHESTSEAARYILREYFTPSKILVKPVNHRLTRFKFGM